MYLVPYPELHDRIRRMAEARLAELRAAERATGAESEAGDGTTSSFARAAQEAAEAAEMAGVVTSESAAGDVGSRTAVLRAARAAGEGRLLGRPPTVLPPDDSSDDQLQQAAQIERPRRAGRRTKRRASAPAILEAVENRAHQLMSIRL